MQSKRIVLLTRDKQQHRFVANVLSAAATIERIVVDCRPQEPNIKRALALGPRKFLGKAARAFLLKALGDENARQRTLRALFSGRGDVFDLGDRVLRVCGVNSPDTQRILDEIRPNLILVYGTSVVKPQVLNMASELSLNMHTGVSPYYRGTACAFWPVVNGEFDTVGATVHECIDRLDGGKIFAVVRVQVKRGDDLHTIFGRAVTAGADAYARVVRQYLEGRLEGEPQDLRVGREYRGADLTIFAEIGARFRLAMYTAGFGRPKAAE